jgi:hypothetical protein
MLTLNSVNTNSSNYEIYAFMGEVYGSGCPVSYLLIRPPESSIAGAKERYISDILRHLRNEWK